MKNKIKMKNKNKNKINKMNLPKQYDCVTFLLFFL